MTKTKPVIRPSRGVRGGGKQGSIVGLTRREIEARLGVRFEDTYEQSDRKVRWEVRFTIEGAECRIWDWYAPERGNKEWSWCGSRFLMEAVFGDHVQGN